MAKARGTATPPFQLEDPGVRWQRIPGGIRIERALTPAAFARSTLWLTGTWGLVWLVRAEAGFWGLLFLWCAALLFSIYWLLMLHFRGHMELRREDATWAFNGRRRFTGRWHKEVDAVRLVRGPKPVGWGERRRHAVEVRADGRWTEIIHGGGKAKKADRLAREAAEWLGVPYSEHEKTYEPDIGGAVRTWREKRRKTQEADAGATQK